jgi:hypothetical protein
MTPLQLESLALSLLCQSPSPQLRSELLSLLHPYNFLSPDHAAIFSALRSLLSLPSRSPSDIHLHLPAALTRLGFPDTDTSPYFSTPLTQSEIDEVLLFFRQAAAKNFRPR